ncbi:NAD(P)/FAD-dependent oxidoreductase [Mycobacterium sp. PSTR-4-N]|uniref:flavin monoamine oxidase family protein n=1 Tax=Mycobacterium sp. PSTR-4-N TaxID=2917745 RepID=UPI001F14CC9F|nr:NAD(P)/FAD-dependent oxidoreductase [Mycobacterium sp. PSTR-4-N]MCG7597308.1 FAD-dependent oxidoreductase [Mycobacterium sp. PSTR-4-N]
MTTIVVGAGPAGLEAARVLVSRGEDVTVLEANPHVGGRTRTDRTRLCYGQPADLGGSLIDLGQDKILAVCAELGIELTSQFALFPAEPGGSYTAASHVRNPMVLDGARVDDIAAQRIAQEVSDALTRTPPEPTEPVLAWTRRSGVSQCARTALAGVTGYNPVSHPALVPMGEIHPPTTGRVVWMLADGTDSVTRAMAEGLDIRLEQPVRLIRRTQRGVVVETDSDTFAADDVVVATPVTPTMAIGFDPVLPEWKANALLSTPMSQGAKVIGQYSDGAAIAARLPRTALGDDRVTALWTRAVGPHDSIVVLGFVPDRGDGTSHDEEQALQALDGLVRTASGVPARRLSGILKDWTQDEYAGGVVSMLFGDRIRLQALLAAAVGPVHFCGEHTANMWATAIDGAMRSGERAADEVLQRRESLR